MSDQTPENGNKVNLTSANIHRAAEDAAEETNMQLDARIASLTKLTQEDISYTFPTKADKQKLDELITILNSSMSRQQKINAIIDKSERFAGIIISLLGKII
ncbi:MAG TPA: hypothetical protein VK021_00780 [Flavobacteriaceae bacterium]|nr:hypothetical protein [Flavobacteriaceae bacterium]